MIGPALWLVLGFGLGHLCLLHHTASATKCPPVRSPVAGDVSCSDVAGLWKRHPRQQSAVSAQATSVGDELCCLVDVLIVAVRPRHSSSMPTALVEGKGAN